MGETQKNHEKRITSGFYKAYMRGFGLDIGFAGYDSGSPVLPTATGIDVGFPGYDGINLPFGEESQDYVYSSHVLEHINKPELALKEWYRVTRFNGFIIIIVPHKFLYEKKLNQPSLYNLDHKRFYTPQSLLNFIEFNLEPNTYRIRHLRDNDDNFDYTIPPEKHSSGSYEIELVVEKIRGPAWKMK